LFIHLALGGVMGAQFAIVSASILPLSARILAYPHIKSPLLIYIFRCRSLWHA
jgi:hypothetical protein